MYRYYRAAAIDLASEGLDGLVKGVPTTLYHGTTKLFRRFDISLSRDELVNAYYGRGIFLTPSKRIAIDYADANRNIGFDPSIIADLKKKNPNAGEFLQALYEKGGEQAWDNLVNNMEEDGPFWTAKDGLNHAALDKHFGKVDLNTLGDIADYIVGSNSPSSSDNGSGFVNVFNMSSGAPDWLYDSLDEVGLNSKVYRPKVYTVVARCNNTLVTANKSAAKKAMSKGYDSVIYHGPGLVKGVPEVAVFNPRMVKIVKIEVV